MIKALGAFALILSFLAIASLPCEAASPKETVVTISNKLDGSPTCTGVAIGPNLVWTATHCVDDPKLPKFNGKSCPTDKILAKDTTDNSLVSTCATFPSWAKVATIPPTEGMPVKQWGHVLGFPLQYREGHYTGAAPSRWAPGKGSLMWLWHLSAGPGDSGSPVFNPQGEVMCVLFGNVYMPLEAFHLASCYVPQFTKAQWKLAYAP